MTAEEKGLLGSRYFATRPAIAGGVMVANLNTDMFLPLFPLKSVVVQGLEESDLAADLRAVAAPMNSRSSATLNRNGTPSRAATSTASSAAVCPHYR